MLFPRTIEEVQQIAKLCNHYRVPIVPYGSGTSLEGTHPREYSRMSRPRNSLEVYDNASHAGHTSPMQRGCVTVDFSQMKALVKLHLADMDVVVQPGIQ